MLDVFWARRRALRRSSRRSCVDRCVRGLSGERLNRYGGISSSPIESVLPSKLFNLSSELAIRLDLERPPLKKLSNRLKDLLTLVRPVLPRPPGLSPLVLFWLASSRIFSEFDNIIVCNRCNSIWTEIITPFSKKKSKKPLAKILFNDTEAEHSWKL